MRTIIQREFLYGLPYVINNNFIKQDTDAHLYTGFIEELPRPSMYSHQ
jgi:hypothetical protein